MRAPHVVVAAAALVLTAALSGAAPAKQPASLSSETTADLFGGYSRTEAGEAGLDGWSLVGSHPFRGAWSLVGDLSGHYGSFAGADLSQLAFLAGVRWSAPTGGRLGPFAEALLGAARTSTSVSTGGGAVSEADVDWGFGLGAGLDYRLGRRWSARVDVQLRFLRGEGATDEDFLVAVGAVYRFGR
jgi:hypothetical protein